MNRYDDMLHLPHHVSPTRPPMSMVDRAAQFSPFAALSGYGAAIKETGRLTEERSELGEDSRWELNGKLGVLLSRLGQCPEVSITYFQPDGHKVGGAYRTVTGRVKKLDPITGLLTLTDGTKIPMEDIREIEGESLEIQEET